MPARFSTNSSLSDEQQSIYLYHAMPASWRNDLQIWKGTRKFIPYAELRHNIEQKVRDELAKTKYIVQKGFPESAETSAETALHAVETNSNVTTALVSATKRCDYCSRENHVLRYYRILQRDLLAGRVKGGTVLPENFSVNVPNRGPTNSYPPIRRFANAVSVERKNADCQQCNNNKQTDYGIAVTGPLVEHMSLAASVTTPDLTWTVDSGCTRHITAVKDWFTSLTSSSGSITVGGKTEIPVEGTGSIRLVMEDAKGATRTVDLDNVLYAPNLKFNLLSVPNAVRNDFKIVFDPKKGTLYYRILVRLKHSWTSTFIDDYSRYMYFYVIRNKSELHECYDCFRLSAVTLFRKDIEHLEYRTNHFDPEIQVLQSDNAKEYEMLGRHISPTYGTHAQFTNAYTPQQNGVAERRIRTILERTRAFLIDGSLPQQLWGECVTHACNLINTTPSTAMGNKTPYEKWYQRKPSSQASRNKKGYRLMDVKINKIVYSRDVVFKEGDFPTLACIAPAAVPPTNATTTGHADFTLLPSLQSVGGSHLQQAHISTASTHLKRPADGNPANCLPLRTTKRANLSDTEPTHDYLNPPADLNEAEVRLQHQYVLLASWQVAEPRTYREALRSDHAPEWRHAAQAECQCLIDNDTGKLAPQPRGRSVLGCLWVFVVKYDANGHIDRFKARLIITGFLQRYGIDYDEIFSPVIRMEVLRLLLTIPALLDYEIHQIDVKNAFLNGFIDIEIYMRQPEGFEVPGNENFVCNLVKSLYGLKQAPRVCVRLSKDMCARTESDKEEMHNIPYREAVGSFMYLVMGTRPDLTYFIQEVSHFLDNPGKQHWKDMQRGLRYLNGTREYGILLGGERNTNANTIGSLVNAYTDADYANCPDTRRSIGGYITMLGRSPISWLSRKHHTIVLSTTEAEYIALCHCLQETIFLRLLLAELGFNTQKCITVMENNQSCIKIANKPEHHGRSKHVEIRFHFVQEKIERQEFMIRYCPTAEMIAGIFTKALGKDQFLKLRRQLGVHQLSGQNLLFG
ncbi:unnamed protein product [Phytophthora fragariaefolia]|uniref:Unnamed protein product n=1 Tax=Phytophthora fragariaefolia TaxID=1490495 RepID=A0A9W6XMI6_9STRA|nr:unnamed protein product [Phytophthora fragariaefolia]